MFLILILIQTGWEHAEGKRAEIVSIIYESQPEGTKALRETKSKVELTGS